MSIGPAPKDEKFATSIVDKARYFTKQTFTAYFDDPLHYIFYISLFATVVGLFVGMEFPWQFYALMLILSAVKVIRFYKPINTKGDVAAK